MRDSVAARSNGQALYEVPTTWTGHAMKQLVARAVITPKRIETALCTWNRADGTRVSRYVPGVKYQYLLAYRAEGEHRWTFLPGLVDV